MYWHTVIWNNFPYVWNVYVNGEEKLQRCPGQTETAAWPCWLEWCYRLSLDSDVQLDSFGELFWWPVFVGWISLVSKELKKKKKINVLPDVI